MDHPSRTARAPWRDLRLLLGIVLVTASIASVWFIVTTSRATAPALQTTRTILVGEVLSSADVRTVEVGLGSLSESYLSPGDLSPGTLAVRTIAEGELLPRSATGRAGDVTSTTIVVESAVAVSESVGAGTRVEVWAAAAAEDGRGHLAPVVLVPHATVAAVVPASGMISSGQSRVELIVERAEVATLLAALADQSVISIVPLAGDGS